MRPSELFAGARAVPVALGLTPKLQALRAQSDGETKDESIPLWQPLAKVPDASNVWHHQQVQDLVLKFWDLYRKDEDNTITEEDFAQLSLRFLRIFLPGLTQEEEKHLCQNCWQEAAAGRRRLSFLGFFPYLVRLVQSWTDSSDPNDYVEFLQNLLDRCTCFQVAGQEQPVFPKRLVTFRAAQRGDDLGDGFNDFMESVELVCSGSLEEVQVELQFEVQHGINFHSCFFEEHFEAPAEPCRRVWMDLGRVWPLGYASLVAIRSLRNEPPMTLNCSDKKADLLQSALETLKSQASEAQAVCQISEEGKVLVSQGEFAPRLFSAVVNEGMISGSFVLKPNRGSFMLKLSDLRKQLLLPQSNARWAAESMGSCKPQQCLPSFPVSYPVVSSRSWRLLHLVLRFLLLKGPVNPCVVSTMTPSPCQAGLAVASMRSSCKPDFAEFQSEDPPAPGMERTPRASYYDIETSRKNNRLEHQQHLRQLKQFTKEITSEQLLQKVIEKRLQEFDQINVNKLRASKGSLCSASPAHTTATHQPTRPMG